ncbi:THUMP-like domain-containing protein [Chloroflexus sp.]|uniref:THUMP-like domain-containing protein n=1 Tax=Chloroflexus sp. TaxID=1904827 RepID=UPI0026301AA8|nr:class I SAM-dependent methyltransferase [uncultured Chloroflexus sp.]
MDPGLIHWLRSAEGTAILSELAGRELRDTDILIEITRLRRHLPAERARAAVEQTLLRRKAAAKFPRADRMFFTRDALEQASAASVAAHRARRLAPTGLVADLGCGIGGDTIALASAGAQVIAVDRDPVRLALAQANVEALGLAERVTFSERDLLREPPPPAQALFCDPARRIGDRRIFDPNAYQPPLSHVLSWRRQTPALAVKLAPGIDRAELPVEAEVEFVSLDGELKEAVLWCEPLATASQRATVLRSDNTMATITNHSPPLPPLSLPLAVLYEPDPAVIRAGLVAELAAAIGAAQLSPDIAYLTAPTHNPTPFARAWSIVTWLPFNLKRLRALLRELDAGPVTVKKRGSPLDTDTLARQLRGKGERALIVVLTQIPAGPVALICEEQTTDQHKSYTGWNPTND